MAKKNTSYYFNEIYKIPLLTKEEEKFLAIKAYAGNKWAQNKLVEHNLRFVAKIAVKYQNYMDMEDLVAEGSLGLIRAAEKFNPERGTKFITYAVFWIKAYIQQAIRKTSCGIRFPATRFEEMKKWKMASLDKSIANKDDDDAALSDFIEDEKVPDPSVEICSKELVLQLEKSLEMLGERERHVVNRRFGLDGNKPMSLSQIGAQMGYSKETIRKIESNALRKLRNNIDKAGGYADLAA